MPKSTATCNSIVNLMYRATAWANVADNAASSPLTNTYVALHTADLTAGTNSQAQNETAYTDYARQAVARSTGWDAASGGATQNAATISFPQCGASGATLTGTGELTADLVVTGTGLTTGNVGAAVWAWIIEAGYSAEEVLRIIAAHAAGAATGLEGANPQFTGLDGSTVRIDGTYSAGTRTIDALDGS